MSSSAEEPVFLDATLRPATWDEYVGQEPIKNNLHILISAAKERSAPPEHILFYGPPGLGKTTLAHLIAHELGGALRSTSGPAIERVGDLAALLTNMGPGDILFIDEIHRLSRAIEEMLYPAMESGVLNIIIGKGPSARTIELPLPPFTLIAATTRVADLSAPLRSRFGMHNRLDYYSAEELQQVITRSAQLLELDANSEGALEIAKRSRGTPRIANNLLKWVRDFATVRAKGKVNRDVADQALNMLEIDMYGLDEMDKRILETLIVKFGGGPVGMHSLAVAVGEEPGTVEEVHEPFLIMEGYLQRTQQGRVALPLSYQRLNIKPPTGQPTLL